MICSGSQPESPEFGGPLGAIMAVILMPFTVFIINAACNKESCTILQMPKIHSKLGKFVDFEAFGMYLIWLIFQWSLHLLLAGKVVKGRPLANGRRLEYTCNGFLSFLATIVAFGVSVYLGHDVIIIFDKYFALITSATAVSFVLSMMVYVKSFGAGEDSLSPKGNTGHQVYDFHMGRELNPRIGDFDLKFFCELRPGLIGWTVLELSFLVKDYKDTGSLSYPLVLVTAFHALYVADALFFEESVLSTLDVTTEGFGFMLIFGDLTWVPFIFSLQTRFLLEHPQPWSSLALVAIALLNSIGYLIFRISNNEKDLFRRQPDHPNVRGLETIDTGIPGRALLVSSWWGTVRHPNYLGDLIMAFAWCLPCGFSHALPWFYLIYLSGTLFHRVGRDDILCRKKYGKAWEKYCDRVVYKIIPGLY